MLLDIVGHQGLANLDEQIFNTWQAAVGTPWVLLGGKFEPVDNAVPAGPGAFVTTATPTERGFNAWYNAPGYYVDAPGVDRVIPDQYVRLGEYQPQIMRVGSGGNPWDWIYGTVGSYGHDIGVGVRNWPDQSSSQSLS